MSFLNLDAREIQKNVERKLELVNIINGNQETYGDFFLDGKYQFRVTMPNIHGGSSKSISTGLLKSCRDSVYLNSKEYFNLVKCPLSREDYIEIISKIILEF